MDRGRGRLDDNRFERSKLFFVSMFIALGRFCLCYASRSGGLDAHSELTPAVEP